jgi:ATP-dependent helicase HepA
MKKIFVAGSRYMSLTEPELGLGIIVEAIDKQLKVKFLAADLERVYGIKTAPLKRVVFEVGDEIKSRAGETIEVEETNEKEGLIEYTGAGITISEFDLDDHLSFNKPEEKLYNNAIDSEEFFQLRLKTLELLKKWETSDVKGLFGGRISLLAHQLYVAEEVLKRPDPRVLLADEVGLGKTIEAGLILHKLITTGRHSRVLIVVPDALTYQWFFEMHRKFQLGFVAINQETPPEPGINPFLQNERIIVSANLLKGSEMAKKMLSEADFDLLVVDEAHQYKSGSADYDLLEDLSSRIPAVLLLTATPEQLGLQGHFDRLRLLDPERYYDFEVFKNEVKEYEKVADLSRRLINENTNDEDKKLLKSLVPDAENKTSDEIVRSLIDRHGTGRVFFRNTRASMRKEFDFFPKRVLHPYPLKNEKESFSLKLSWLVEFLKENKNKVLLICHSKDMVLDIEKGLAEYLPSLKVGVFHSGQTLMARDRQAAYFSDANGSQLLLCTEIGSEGRNFEFASHLVLFDLPKKPDLLEQRIGRLDRIGQKGDVNIHVPYMLESEEEVLFNIYDEGLDSFKRFSSVGTPVFIQFTDEINNILTGKEKVSSSLLSNIKKHREELEAELEKGRDLLIEMNSFNPKRGNELVQSIKAWEELPDLSTYMEQAFACFGVDVDDLNTYAQFIKPNDNMFIPYFPHLDREGMTITFDRRESLEREDYTFINWDHGMVRELMNLVLSESYGNMTVAMRKDGKGKKSFVEAYYVLDCPGPKELDIKTFFPPTVIRVLVDKDGEDFSEKWSKDLLDEKLVTADRECVQRAQKIPKKMLTSLIKMAFEKATSYAVPLKEEMILNAASRLKAEEQRIIELSLVNDSVGEEDVLIVKAMNHQLMSQTKEFRLRLEALRVIL